MRIKCISLFCGFFLFWAGCLPLTHLSPAPTQKPGHFELALGGNFLQGDGSGVGPVIGARIGLAPRIDLGLIEDSLSTNMDIKIHCITDEMAKFDLSASIGAGVSILAVYKYFNIIISKEAGKHSPYFAWRHTYIDNNKPENDTTAKDESGLHGVLYTLLFEGVVGNLNQFFIGYEYAVSPRTSFAVEGMFLPVDGTENLFSINAGFKFKF